MAHTEAQAGTHGAPLSPAPKTKGTGSRSPSTPRRSRSPKHTAPCETAVLREWPAPVQSGRHKRKNSIEDALQPASDHKRQRVPPLRTAEGAFCEPADARGAHEHVDPLAFWVKEQRWPQEQDWPEATSETDAAMDPPFARKKPSSTLSRKRLSSGTSATPSDQRPREEKSTPYRHQRYETLLQVRGSYMTGAPLGLASRSQALCRSLFDKIPTLPSDTLFRHDIFKTTLDKIRDKNEARVIQDISRLIVPSAERLATFGAAHLDILTESVNEGWNNSIPFTSPCPQPDYSVGFKRDAFTDDQLEKLSPFLGDFIAGDQSFFMATYYMYFPFLTCEVKCGAGALDIADRQNAHSMTVAVRGIVELFRCVKREDEVNRQILAFSISHDARSVAIYGHYPVVDGKNTKYYRHLLRMFYLAESGENDRWTAYQFTKNVYDKWMPKHYENICSAINQLPSDLEFDVAPLSETTWPSTAPARPLASRTGDQALPSSKRPLQTPHPVGWQENERRGDRVDGWDHGSRHCHCGKEGGTARGRADR